MGCHASGNIRVVSRSCIPRLADWSVGITLNPEKQVEQVSITYPRVDSQIRHGLATHTLFGSPAGFDYLARHTNVHQRSVTARWLHDIADSPAHAFYLTATKIHSAIILPVDIGGRPVCAVVLFLSDPERHFSPADLRLCHVLRESLRNDITTRAAHQAGARLASKPDERASHFESQLAVYNHELRNSISSIKSWTRYLKAGRKDVNGGVLAEGLRVIERNSEILEQLTEDGPVVGCSSSETPARQDSLDLNQLLTDCIEDCRAIAKASSIVISQQRTAAPLWIRGHRVRIHQVFTNLLLNSIKYGFPGGLVRVVSKFQDGHAKVEIQDNGIGIKQTLLTDIFRPRNHRAMAFLHASRHGSGLGLAFSLGIVRNHGGHLWAESAGRGLGSTFHVSIPLAADQPDVGTDPSELGLAGLAPMEPVRILLVEDSQEALALLKLELETLRHTVFTAQNTAEAFEIAEREHPDLIISDILLAGSDAYDLIRRIRQSPELSSIPALALSGFGSLSQRNQAIGAGFNAYVRKPAEPRELHSAIQRLASHRTAESKGTAA